MKNSLKLIIFQKKNVFHDISTNIRVYPTLHEALSIFRLISISSSRYELYFVKIHPINNYLLRIISKFYFSGKRRKSVSIQTNDKASCQRIIESVEKRNKINVYFILYHSAASTGSALYRPLPIY